MNVSQARLKTVDSRSDATKLPADIEQARAEISVLRALIEDFELARTALTEGLWELHMVNGDPDHQASRISWSRQFRTLLGYEREEDFPNNWDSWTKSIHPDDLDQTMQLFSAHLQDHSGATPYRAEYRLMTSDRGYVWFRERAATLRITDGIPLKSAGAIRDISDERAAKEMHEAEVVRAQSRMREILSVADAITEINKQTNLVAFNAAIEAARAGEAGKGFSVIAQEIRNLVVRTSDANEKIREMARKTG